MKAVVQAAYGGPEVYQIASLAKPTPKPNELLIKIHATSASASDGAMRKGKPYIGRLYTGLTKPKRVVPGVEFSGEVEAIGKNVTQFKPGDQVLGETSKLGCYAEYICLAEHELIVTKPPSMSHKEAAPICAGAVTALNLLKLANIQKGHKVLVYGASGSVGTYAVQVAKALGAHVTGVCSSRNVLLVQSLGADAVIDYTSKDFSKDKKCYDIVFDTVGKISFGKSKKVLSTKGVFVSCCLSFPLLLQLIATSIFGQKKAKFSATGALPVTKRLPLLKEIKALYEAKSIKTVIDKCYPLEHIVQAHNYVDTGRKRGNVILEMRT